jgi:beta-lactamase class A
VAAGTAIATAPTLPASATLIDLNTGKEYDAGTYTQTFQAASTSKLVAIFAYIHQVELGKATLTQVMEGQTAQDIIQNMIVNSDNDAWDILNRYLTFKGEQTYLNSIDVAGKMVPNNIQFSTPAMAKMLQLLYQGKLMNAQHRAMVYGYMQHTTMNTLIPAALPTDATIYHKYGQIDGVFHDAAIVGYQGYNFVLVVYTDGGQNGAQSNLIHAVTTAAFNDVVKG